ncbi:MAG TPA: hypothetical protein VFB12_22430 [Ktedonobacteraceae bacterium]|nr:hypothetical protein [Ktedonobacteraceae bacterium]
MTPQGERGYPWYFFHANKQWAMTTLVTLLLSALSIAIYIVYNQLTKDRSPDSILGYTFAIVGTFFMLLAAIRYMLYRRSRKRAVGQLNVSLHWHICFGVVAMVLLLLHSFGNFNPRSGTYALYGMIAMVVSGVIGRMIDRFVPRMVAREVDKALTWQGEDRVEEISRQLQAIVVHNTQEEIRGFAPGVPTRNAAANRRQNPAMAGSAMSNGRGAAPLQTPWDLAYITLDETPQEVSRDSQQYRFVPDRRSALSRPGALIPGAQEHMAALRDVRKALQREQFYRYLTRYWRIFHIVLALVTIALTLWHLEYATAFLIPVFFH